MIKCITIDDEPLALRQLRSYIARVPYLEQTGEYSNALDASEALETTAVDLIFCDINMPDCNGVDFVRTLPADRRPMVVFTTAYSEYAVEGFKLEAVDYLLKPFGFDEFNRAVQRVRSLYDLVHNRRNTPAEEETGVALQQDNREFLSVKTDHMVSLVKLENILYLESMGEYVRIHTAEGKTLTTLYRLKNMETVLPADSFMRVHRSYIVNLRRIAGYAKGRIFFSTDERDSVPIGENYRNAFIAYTEKAYNTL